jgi:large subunit ribosomal protein L30
VADKPKRPQPRTRRRETGKRDGTQDATLRVTWVHSEIGHNAAARGTIRALGLHRLHETVHVADTPANRGMIRRVAFLLEVAGPSGRAEPEESQS